MERLNFSKNQHSSLDSANKSDIIQLYRGVREMRLEKKDDNPKKGEMTYDEKQFVEQRFI